MLWGGVREGCCDWSHGEVCVQSLRRPLGICARVKIPTSRAKSAREMGHPASCGLAPIVTVAMAVVITIAAAVVFTVSTAIGALVAIAVGLLVVAFVAHPMFVAAGVFPVVVFEIETAAAISVEVPGALPIVESSAITLFAGLVVAISIIVIVLRGLTPCHTAVGQRNGGRQRSHSDPTPYQVTPHNHLRRSKRRLVCESDASALGADA